MFGKPLKIVVAGLLAATALTACTPGKPGAAAIVGNGRITEATLDAVVTRWAKELPSHPAAQQIVARSQSGAPGTQVPFDPASPPRSALFGLVSLQVWDEAARAEAVRVTSGQLDAFVTSLGGQPALDAYTLAQGLPLSYGRAFARVVLIQQTMLARYLPTQPKKLDPQTVARVQQAQQAAVARLQAAQRSAARRLNVRINPRFGSFDTASMQLGPVCPALSIPDPGTNAPGGAGCQL